MKPNRLEELRDILLRPDQEKLDELRARIEEADQRADDVAEVLPDSVTSSFARDSRLIQALRSPLRQCVSESVREDPEEYADALFPIMGPAIRRAVAEAFKAWIQQANQALEQSFSPRNLAWRFEAWRAGVPYGEYVLQRTLAYRVEDIYLVHSASGLLIGHVTDKARGAKDEDAVSAMFTAIQDFVKDSFAREQSGELTTAELGELTLWAVHGPTATIIAVIRGVPPAALRTELERTLEQIETQHSQALREYSGNRESMAHLEPDLRSCLMVSLKDSLERESGPRLSPALLFVVLTAAGFLLWFSYGFWMQSRVDRVADAFDATPGIVITRLERAGQTIAVRGLRDPLAPLPSELAAAAGWSGALDGEFTPFLSLEDVLVLERARVVLAPPDSVTMQIEAGVLTIQGSASSAWISELGSAVDAVPGVVGVDHSAVAVADVVTLEQLREMLDPPATINLSLEEAVLDVSGEAPKEWLDAIPAASEFPGVASVDDSAVVLSEQRLMESIARGINATSMSFDTGQAILPTTQSDNIAQLASELAEYAALGDALDLEPRLTIMGHSADSGSDATNIAIEQRRAEEIAAALLAAGVEARWVTTLSQLEAQAPGPRTPQVTLRLDAVASGSSAGQD
ncbi:MAG: hypothetical protein ACR2QQ_16080 [Gammaproteobacteria bacterium]